MVCSSLSGLLFFVKLSQLVFKDDLYLKVNNLQYNHRISNNYLPLAGSSYVQGKVILFGICQVVLLVTVMLYLTYLTWDFCGTALVLYTYLDQVITIIILLGIEIAGLGHFHSAVVEKNCTSIEKN